MTLQIIQARAEDRHILRGLLADCLAELAAYGAVDLAYPYFEAYWDPLERRWPYLLLQGGDVAGFALVNSWSPSGRGTDFAIAEFYIAPEARQSGIGCEAAARIFLMQPGLWELAITSRNKPALQFWPKAIAKADGRAVERIEADGETIYRFRTA